MKKLIGVVVAVLLLAVPATAITYQIDPTISSWSQTPAAGGIGSVVGAAGQLLAVPSSFALQAQKNVDAIPSTKPGYTWETVYTPVALAIQAGTWTANVGGVTSMTNYNNNSGGLPSEFLFVVEGVGTDGSAYRVEAYWNANQDPLVLDGVPEIVVAGLTEGTLEIVPEPLTMLGLGMGLVGIGGYIRKRRMR
jgi:hypothetical protein